jgi:hypothetical protein
MNLQSKTRPDDVKLRVIMLKRLVPHNFDYVPAYEEMFGEMSNELKGRVRSVWNLAACDPEITANLEILAQKVSA